MTFEDINLLESAMQEMIQTIPQAFAELRNQGFIRQREAAERLHLSEGELLAAHVNAQALLSEFRVIRLRSEWHSLLVAVEHLGEVMALTRNASCVHEKIGIYRKATLTDQVGVISTEAIDLRAFYSKWAHGFAVIETTQHGLQRSLQFFDISGTAIHKIFLRENSHTQAYDAVIERFAAGVQQPGLYVEIIPSKPPETADEKIDIDAMHLAWERLRDTHEFFFLLKTHGVSRVQALRLAQPKFVQQVHCADILRVLTAAAARKVSVMVFVGNLGMLQIHSGPINQVSYSRPWLNVLDASFNLHLRIDQIATAWIVKKPTSDGVVTSFEIFDTQGEVIAMLFGLRQPGQPELSTWRELLIEIQETQQACAV